MAETKAKKPLGRPALYGDRANVTMSWPISMRKAIDAAAEAEGKTRTEFVLDWAMRHPAVIKAMEAAAH